MKQTCRRTDGWMDGTADKQAGSKIQRNRNHQTSTLYIKSEWRAPFVHPSILTLHIYCNALHTYSPEYYLVVSDVSIAFQQKSWTLVLCQVNLDHKKTTKNYFPIKRQISAENVANKHLQQTTADQLYCGDHKFVLRRGRDNRQLGQMHDM